MGDVDHTNGRQSWGVNDVAVGLGPSDHVVEYRDGKTDEKLLEGDEQSYVHGRLDGW